MVLGELGSAAGHLGVVRLGVVWATGSRTALLMLLAALAVMALHVRRPRVGLVVGGLVLGGVGRGRGRDAPGCSAASSSATATGASTLESRFIAWRATLRGRTSLWQQVFGGGLSVKIIQVQGQWWDTQPLDSSWVSLLVQTGVLGLVVAAGWVLWVLRGVLRAPRAHRALFLGLLVFLVGRSVLESGLFDATPAFLVFFAVSLLAEGGTRARLRDEARPAAARTVPRHPVDRPAPPPVAGGAGRRPGGARPAVTTRPRRCSGPLWLVSGRSRRPSPIGRPLEATTDSATAPRRRRRQGRPWSAAPSAGTAGRPSPRRRSRRSGPPGVRAAR